MSDDRADLGAMLHRARQLVIERELPLLESQGLQMWDYAVLSGLAGASSPTQAQLADTVRRDRTRLIITLDRLEAAGLVEREIDPDDRRNRIVSMTPDGKRRLARCRALIRDMERDLLAALPKTHRERFLADLAALLDADGDA